MREGIIYFVKSEFYEIIRTIGGEWNDNKKRPVVCLLKLKEREYLGYNGTPYEIKNKNMLSELKRKLGRVLYFETKRPNYFRQHITDIKNFLLNEEEDKTYEYRI